MYRRYPFRLLGDYTHVRNANGDFVTAPSIMSPPGLEQFLAAQAIDGVARLRLPDDSRTAALPLSPRLVSITRTTLSNYDVGTVIVDRSGAGSGPVIKLFNEAIGPPNVSPGQFSMWDNWHTTHIQR